MSPRCILYHRRTVPVLLAAALLLAGPGSAGDSDPRFQVRITGTGPDARSVTCSWWGKAGTYYFVQKIASLSGTWEYAPHAALGNDSEESASFPLEGEAMFLRLESTDDPDAPVLGMDFDGDKVANRHELDHGLDPFDASSEDGDPFPDDWELFWFGSTDERTDQDTDKDTLTDSTEWTKGSSPVLNDSDDDGLPDGLDADPASPDGPGLPAFTPATGNGGAAPQLVLFNSLRN